MFDEDKQDNKCEFGFIVLSIPPNVSVIAFSYILRLKETDSESCTVCTVEPGKLLNYAWDVNNNIDILYKSSIIDLNELTFYAKI